MASPRESAAAAVSAAPTVANTAPCPLVVLDARGRVVELNDAARRLLPAAREGAPLPEPGWLTGAADAGLPEASGPVGARSFAAHSSPLPEGRVAWWLVEDTALRSVREELAEAEAHTRFLSEASTALFASLNLQRCMEVSATLAAGHLADAAVVIAPSSGNKLPVVVCDAEGVLSRSTVAVDATRQVPGLPEALQGFPPVPARWIDPATTPSWLVPPGFGTVGSVAIAPLPGHGVPAGALVLLRKEGKSTFDAPEEAFAGLFAARAGAALSAARLYVEQQSITDVLMRELLPPELSRVAGVEFAGGYRPSRDEERVGGDFYDVHPGTEEGAATLAVLGDVCGKGLEAAVLTGKIRNTLHALVPMAEDHPRMLGLLNTALVNSHHTRFATMVLASARREGPVVHLELTSAGHPAPLIVRTDGTVEAADTQGTLIGVLPTVTHRTTLTSLAPGETCLLYTDGLTEAVGGPLGETMFGEERLKRTLAGCAGMPAEAVVEHVQMVVSDWIGRERHDDMAVLAVTAPRTAPRDSTGDAAVNGGARGRRTA
ncbi:SpoIIE family protein phosphatase [Streptomyces sp. NPDC001941]|uniref:SpoIIE family protein phosphatase n=1 Tax=Streptomyces sp. NPDC001941 TaxID=3154659 RepID=UPI00332E3199